MLYFSFAMVCNHIVAYSIMIFVWSTIFIPRMLNKELSYKRKEGWAEYSQRSWMVLPRINGRLLDSVFVYGIASFGLSAYWKFIQS